MRFAGLVVRPRQRRHRALRGASPPVSPSKSAVAAAAAATSAAAGTGNCAADAVASLPGCAGRGC